MHIFQHVKGLEVGTEVREWIQGQSQDASTWVIHHIICEDDGEVPAAVIAAFAQAGIAADEDGDIDCFVSFDDEEGA